MICDARSPIAKGFASLIGEVLDPVTLLSTTHSEPPAHIEVPLRWWANWTRNPARIEGAPTRANGRLVRYVAGQEKLRDRLHSADAVASVIQARRLGSRHVSRLIRMHGPAFVHALRIPFEGVAAAAAVPTDLPFVVSIWGNDLTLHAGRSATVRRATTAVLRRADALLADCHRDIGMAVELGYSERKPTAVIPGGGGVPLDLLQRARPRTGSSELVKVINPRGYRTYVQTFKFLEALALLRERGVPLDVTCVGLQGIPAVERHVRLLGLEPCVRLTPVLPQPQLWAELAQADIMVSPTTHDGTPNSLLEAMAVGLFPVAGRLESTSEWVTHGGNGLLVDPTDPESIAAAIAQAARSPELRLQAQSINYEIVRLRASRDSARETLRDFYRSLGVL